MDPVLKDLPVLLVVPHAEAGDRSKWTDDQDLRPLTEEGRAQAASLALVVGPVDRIVSSPARRCVETVEPIASGSGIEIELNDDLRELTYVTELATWDAWNSEPLWRAQQIAAAGLGRLGRVVASISSHNADERVVISAHGDLVPLFALLAAGWFHMPAPSPIARGGCFEIDARDLAQPIKSLGALAPLPPST